MLDLGHISPMGSVCCRSFTRVRLVGIYMIWISHTYIYMPVWDLDDLHLSHMFTLVGSVLSAGSAICPRVIAIYQYLVHHTGTGTVSYTHLTLPTICSV